jgi:hypothetical protein
MGLEMKKKILIIISLIILISISSGCLNNDNNNGDEEQNELKRTFGVEIIFDSFEKDNNTGLHNIDWSIAKLPLVDVNQEPGDHTDLFYSIDNGSTWERIVRIPNGSYGSYRFKWNTTRLPNIDYYQIKIIVFNIEFESSKEFVIDDLIISNIEEEIENNFTLDEINKLHLNGSIMNISISLSNVYCWRDFQPVVTDPQPDGGSPLFTKLNVNLTNNQEVKYILTINSWIFYENQSYPIIFKDRGAREINNISVNVNQTLSIEMVNHNGPFVPIDSLVYVLTEFSTDNENIILLSSGPVVVYKTD